MSFRSFEDLNVWKRASRLAVRIYQALGNCRNYGLKDQMTRAAVSIASNIIRTPSGSRAVPGRNSI